MEEWKIAVLGERGVGKTAFAFQFSNGNRFGEETLEPDHRRQLAIDNRMCLVEVLDLTAERESYEPFRNLFIREGQGFILLYSITSRLTFDRVEALHQMMERVKGTHQVCVLVGNKCDKESEHEVPKEDGAALARRLGCEFTETSAETAQNVNPVVISVVRALRQAKDVAAPKPEKPKRKKGKKCIIL
ncbi:ras protein [Mycena capillaripes]|nr:ras protein [Mycena capillaripes]